MAAPGWPASGASSEDPSPLMHGCAYAARERPAAGSKLLIAFSRPTNPTCIRSSADSALLTYLCTQDRTTPWLVGDQQRRKPSDRSRRSAGSPHGLNVHVGASS